MLRIHLDALRDEGVDVAFLIGWCKWEGTVEVVAEVVGCAGA